VKIRLGALSARELPELVKRACEVVGIPFDPAIVMAMNRAEVFRPRAVYNVVEAIARGKSIARAVSDKREKTRRRFRGLGFFCRWWFLQRCIGICFQDYFQLCSWFQACFFARIVREFILHADFPIQIFSVGNCYFCLFWLVGITGFDNPRHGTAHFLPLHSYKIPYVPFIKPRLA
jgi:hypothetical protein